ncbi:TrkH family potassium uptake protein [Falsarthrobacter nasiphocae]
MRLTSARPAPQRTVLSSFVSSRNLVESAINSSPARLAILAFLLIVTLFTVLLMLPAASSNGQSTPLHDALFTAVSAVCVTGLTVVSTADHWSFFGQAVILLGIFIGGLGTLTLASILALVVSKKLGVRGKLIAQEAMNSGNRLGEVGSLLRIVISVSLVAEAIIALWLFVRFLTLGETPAQAAWHGVFYAISTFNNAGFTPHSDGLIPYEFDLWILVPIMLGGFVGSLGFPVMLVLIKKGLVFRTWNLHAKLTVQMSLLLLVVGAILWGLMEWDNVKTIGTLSTPDKIVHALFASVMSRSLGFNLVDMNAMTSDTMLLTDMLMFAGGGSASTAGGIKVTTIAVMFLAILAEARGDEDVKVYGRTIPPGAMRVAISVIVMGGTIVAVGTLLLLRISHESLDRVLFEVISAFATCGLSTGLSGELPAEGKYVLTILMFFGRVGTVTLAAALALRERRTLYHFPEERPIIG